MSAYMPERMSEDTSERTPKYMPERKTDCARKNIRMNITIHARKNLRTHARKNVR